MTFPPMDISEYHLDIRFVLRADTAYAARGCEVAFEQFPLPGGGGPAGPGCL